MLCRTCQEKESHGRGRERRAEPSERRDPPRNFITPRASRRGDGKARMADQLCSHCGHLIGTEDTVRRLRDKQSQLERFGLAGKRSALLKRKREDR